MTILGTQSDKEFRKVSAVLKSQSDNLILVLRVHLLVEQTIDELLIQLLDRADYILDQQFNQKFLILQSLDFLNDNVTISIKKLNYIRNQYSHSVNYKISQRDLDSIGIPLGAPYKDICKKYSKLDTRLESTLMYLLGYLIGTLKGVSK